MQEEGRCRKWLSAVEAKVKAKARAEAKKNYRVQIYFCTLFFLPAEPLGNVGATIGIPEGSFTPKI